jgi:hypothetical protein
VKKPLIAGITGRMDRILQSFFSGKAKKYTAFTLLPLTFSLQPSNEAGRINYERICRTTGHVSILIGKATGSKTLKGNEFKHHFEWSKTCDLRGMSQYLHQDTSA